SPQQPDKLARIVACVGFFPLAVEARGKLISARLADQPEQAPQAVVAAAKVLCERVQQLRMRRLQLPALRHMPRILPRQIELIVRLHNAHAHQASPKQIYRRTRELGMRGDYP